MSVTSDDMKFRKSEVVTDTVANGGRSGYVEVLPGVKHNLFPRVTKAERTAGVTRYRKQFVRNENTSNEVAYDALLYPEFPTNAGDRILAALGTKDDVQGDIDSTYKWASCGPLNANVSAGDALVTIAMESDDMDILNGGLIHIANKYESGTIDATADIGDSVEYDAGLGKWMPIAYTDDIEYPKGVYIGSSMVMTKQATDTEEWLRIADVTHTDEDIGTGDGADTSPALTTLANVPICMDTGKLPVVTTLDALDATMTVNVAADGSCSGDCSAGELNMETGVWTTDITWTSAPKNLQDILVTYHERAYTWAGNVVTINLDDLLANDYLAAETYVGVCIELGDIEPVSENWAEVSAAGTYDEATYPLVLDNRGTVTDTITITFTNATNFGCTGANEGSLGSGSTGVDFAPINPNTGQPYFTLDKDGWGGSWVLGDTVSFDIISAGAGVWLKEIVPALTSAEAFNLFILSLYCE